MTYSMTYFKANKKQLASIPGETLAKSLSTLVIDLSFDRLNAQCA
jgi:hypothetical protein